MIRAGDCERTIRKGLDFLAKSQLSSGEFPTYFAKDKNLTLDVRFDSSVFATAHIISSLASTGFLESALLIRRAAEFLNSQRLPGGFWKFWTRQHPGFSIIPPDIDDSSVIAMALQDSGLEVHQNSLLLASNRDESGRFFTWLKLGFGAFLHVSNWREIALWFPPNRGKKKFFLSGQASCNDFDAVVNANTVSWLADLKDITTPAARWIEKVIISGKEEEADRYYQSRFALYYAVSRGAKRGVIPFKDLKGLLAERLLEAQSHRGMIGNGPHETALASVVLSHGKAMSKGHQKTIEFLIKTQREDGSWPPLAFYFGGFNKTRQWGSAELTTGFCLEALARYLKLSA